MREQDGLTVKATSRPMDNYLLGFPPSWGYSGGSWYCAISFHCCEGWQGGKSLPREESGTIKRISQKYLELLQTFLMATPR